jgi:hypothetical protein
MSSSTTAEKHGSMLGWERPDLERPSFSIPSRPFPSLATIVSFFTASTGIVATLLRSRTIDSAFAICQKGDNYLSNLRITNRQAAAMSNLEFLFIDEASMLNGRVFNLVDAKLRELKQAGFGDRRGGVSFGSVTVFITGDVGQVPVVIPRSLDMIEAISMFVNMA